MPLATFAAHVGGVLEREPLVLGEPGQMVRSIGWCTGGAQGYFDAAVAAGSTLT